MLTLTKANTILYKQQEQVVTLYYTNDAFITATNEKIVINRILVTRFKDDDYVAIGVEHNATDYDLYYDAEFEKAISKALNYDVCFTEQGQQESDYASLETQLDGDGMLALSREF